MQTHSAQCQLGAAGPGLHCRTQARACRWTTLLCGTGAVGCSVTMRLYASFALQVSDARRLAFCSHVRSQAYMRCSARQSRSAVKCAASENNSKAPTAAQTGKIGRITLTKDTESIQDVMAFTGPAPEVSTTLPLTRYPCNDTSRSVYLFRSHAPAQCF